MIRYVSTRGLAPTLDFNDLGYMRRQNLLQFFAQLEHRTLEPWRRTLETHNRVGFFSRDSLQGRTLFRSFFTTSATVSLSARSASITVVREIESPSRNFMAMAV